MTRNYLKALGLALIAAFAMSAVIASSASAEDEQGVLTTELGNPVTLTAEETGEEANFFVSYGGAVVKCPNSTYTGHKWDATPHELIPNNSTTATVTPHYVGCTATTPFGNRPATVKMTDCDFEFTLGSTTPAENTDGTYGVNTHIECDKPDSEGIHIEVYEDEAHENRICTITVTPNQTDLTGLHLTNTPGKGDFDIEGTIEGQIHSVRSGLCTLDGKGTTDPEGDFTADVTVEAHEELGNPEGVTITDAR